MPTKCVILQGELWAEHRIAEINQETLTIIAICSACDRKIINKNPN